jgi:hypothetical protein
VAKVAYQGVDLSACGGNSRYWQGAEAPCVTLTEIVSRGPRRSVVTGDPRPTNGPLLRVSSAHNLAGSYFAPVRPPAHLLPAYAGSGDLDDRFRRHVVAP